jgi:hypothetical protein
MTAENKCLFGISKPVVGLGPSASDDTWTKDKCAIIYSGECSKLFRLMYERMRDTTVPRYSARGAPKSAHDDLDCRYGRAAASSVWNSREIATVLPLEEANLVH